MPAPVGFDYAIVRVVPRVDRDEFINVGVILHCPERGFVGCALELDEARLRVLAPNADVTAISRHLDGIRGVCAGSPAAGPLASLTPSERFHWLTTPRSTAIQTSAIHAGRCEDPTAALNQVFASVIDVANTGDTRPMGRQPR